MAVEIPGLAEKGLIFPKERGSAGAGTSAGAAAAASAP